MLADTRQAIIEIGIDNKRLDADVRESKKKLLGLVQVKGLKGASVLGGMMGGIAGNVFGKLTDAVSSGYDEVMSFEKGLARLGIAGGQTSTQVGQLREKLMEISNVTGVARGEVLAGAAAYVRLTGDIQGAKETAFLFAKVVQATGAQMDDVATTAAALRQNLEIDPKDFKQAFDILITQGKAGAIELNELAQITAGLAPSFVKLGTGTGIKGLQQMGAALQVARQGFGSASEAATGLSSFVTSITRNVKKFGAAGVKIYTGKVDAKGRPIMRDIRSIINDIGNSKLVKKEGALTVAFGDKEPLKFYEIMQKNLALFDELAANRGENAVDKDYGTYMATSAGKIELAANLAKNAIAAAFTPERIEAFAQALGKAADYFAKIVGFVSWLNGEKYKWEKEEEKIEQKTMGSKTRKEGLAVRRYGKQIMKKDFRSGDTRRSEYEKALEDVEKGESTMRTSSVLSRLTPAQKAEIEREMGVEAMIAGGLGGDLGMGSKNKGFMFRKEGFSSTEIMGLLTGYVPQTSDPKAMQAMAIKALAKAMAAEFEKVRINIEKPESEHLTDNRNGRPKP